MKQITRECTAKSSIVPARELLIMTIELEEGRHDVLRVFEGDDPHEVAYKFCLQHSLGIHVVEALKANITENMKTVLAEAQTTQASVPPTTQPEVLRERNTNEMSEKQQTVFDRLQMDANRLLQKQRKNSPKSQRASPRPNQKGSPKGDTSQRRVTATTDGGQQMAKGKFNTIERGPMMVEPGSRMIRPEEAQLEAEAPNRFDQLFEGWKAQAERKKQLEAEVMRAECPFQPALQAKPQKETPFPPFMERMMKGIEDRKEKVRRVREEQQFLGDYDPVTGQRLFNPVVIQRSPKRRNDGQLPVGHYLYNKAEEYTRRKRELFDREQRSLHDARARSNDRSCAIIEGLKKKRLSEIFAMLDSDCDGLISATKIDITRLPTDILELFAPLLCELEEIGDTLNVEEFIASSDRLLRTLSQAERDRVLLGEKRKLQKDQFSFKPEINKRSAKMAEKTRPYGKKELYNVYFEEKKKFEEKIKGLHEEKTKEEVRECSFKPVLISKGSQRHALGKNSTHCRDSSRKLWASQSRPELSSTLS